MLLLELNIPKDPIQGDPKPVDFSKYLTDDGYVSVDGRWYVLDLSRLSSSKLTDKEKQKVYNTFAAKLRKRAADKGFVDDAGFLDTDRRYLLISVAGDSITGSKDDYFHDDLKEVIKLIRQKTGITVENLHPVTPDTLPMIMKHTPLRTIIKMLAD